MKNDSALFFTCSLIEYIGRQQRQTRSDIVSALGQDTLKRIYRYADVLHCEPIAKTADQYISMQKIPVGDYDNVARCKYDVPDYWVIGEVYERLIEDVMQEDAVQMLIEVYGSWIDAAISNYNTDFFYQPRDYIAECYRKGNIL